MTEHEGLAMVDLYYCATPDGPKMVLFFTETGLSHRVIPVDISRGDQFKPGFLAISSNNRIPVMVDRDPAEGSDPVVLFESGAMLLYLAEKTGQLIPANLHDRMEVLEWLFWQVGGLGPMAGQTGHLNVCALGRVHYAIEHYTKETNRLYGVLDRRLADHPYTTDNDYTIVDIAAYPWIVPHVGHGQDLNDFPNLQRWFGAVGARPTTQRAYTGVERAYSRRREDISGDERNVLLGQTASSTTR